MFSVEDNYVLFYPGLVGVEIPGTNRKTKPAHALVWGYYYGFAKQPDGCYSSVETAAKVCHLTPKTVREVRSDLIKLNWVVVKRNNHYKITNVFVKTRFLLCVDAMKQENQAENDTALANENLTPEAYFKRSNHLTSNEVTTLLQMKEAGTPVATPVPKESNIKKDNSNRINTSLDKQAKMCPNVVLDEPPMSSRKEVEDFPFDEEVETHSIRPDEKTKKNPSARAAIVAKRLYEIAGFGDLRPGNLAVSAVRKKMEAGATEKDLTDLMTWTNTDEFYKGQGFMARLGDDAQQKFVLSKNKSKGERYRW